MTETIDRQPKNNLVDPQDALAIALRLALNGDWSMLLRLQAEAAEAEKRQRSKVSYVGAPQIFALELACQQINGAFHDDDEEDGHCYLVGSALERPDWRDVDVRYIMGDRAFARLFPRAGDGGWWEHDPRWLLMTMSLSAHLSKVTGLPIDFQFQPKSHANARHDGARHALGMTIPAAG